ncbi:MAG: 4a-hydroxytetrahydrobiopterin dehydratase [Verrucomicrobiota bacterium]
MSRRPLTSAEIQVALVALPGWAFERDALAKEYRFENFRDALAFMMRVGLVAEELDHHPEWTNIYDRVAVRLNTHAAGGKVTAKDVELAQRIEEIACASGGARH